MSRLTDGRDIETRIDQALFLHDGTGNAATIGRLAELTAMGYDWTALVLLCLDRGLIPEYLASVDMVAIRRLPRADGF